MSSPLLPTSISLTVSSVAISSAVSHAVSTPAAIVTAVATPGGVVPVVATPAAVLLWLDPHPQYQSLQYQRQHSKQSLLQVGQSASGIGNN